MRSTLRRIVQAGRGSVARRGIRSVIRRHVRMVAVAVVISLLLASLPATSGTKQVLARQDGARANTEAHVSFSTRLYQGFSQTLASLGSWLGGRMNSESASSHSAYYPVTAFLSPAPPFIDAPTNLTVTTTSSTTISLSWTAPAGSVDHYQIERSTSVSGPFFFLANASGTTHNDATVSNLQAYLYRVRAVTSGGLPSAPSNMALGTAISFQFSNLLGQEIRAQHFYDVRTAINAARAVAGLPAATWTRTNLAGLEVKADDVLELRTKLNEALTALDITVTAYQDATLNTGANGTLIKAVHIEQLQTRSTRGSSNSSGPLDSDSSTARLDPLNETGGGGENPLSRNFNWNLTLVSLPGRAGMDLDLRLSHNSLVWARSGNVISFDDDGGFPSPGFRLGFPVIQPLYYNTEVGKYAYLLIGSDGSRTELRQVGTSAMFESADSAHLLLDTSLTLPAPDNDKFILRTTDGTRLLYALKGGVYQCTEIKDRNGNYITINYTTFGRIDTVVDTLARSIKFNYDANDRLTSITQLWNQGLANEAPHNWATFEYSEPTIQTNFSGLTVLGPSNNSTIKMLSKVTLADGSRFDFSYTSWGQVWKVSNFAADNHLLNYRSYNLPQTNTTAHTDCPRFTERRDWAENWIRSGPAGASGLPSGAEQEVVTTYAVPVSDSWTMPDTSAASGIRAQVTAPDGTSNKIYFIGSAGTATGWRRGLPALVNTFDSGNTLRRQVMTTWRQDNENLSYPLNPRVEETNVYDPANNRKRTRVSFQTVTLPNEMSCKLPQDVYEYQANASTVLRRTHTDYNLTTPYTSRRVIGLPSEKTLYEVDPSTLVETLMSKVSFHYDESGSIQGNDAPVQHDNAAFSDSFVTGRANLSSVKRYDVTNTAVFTTTSSKYNTAGSVVSSKDAADHEITVSYSDAFATNGTTLDPARPFMTLAYPTTVNDADNYSRRTRYHYDFGAPTWQQTPLPGQTANLAGPEQKITYDDVGRVQQITSLANGAYTKFVYSSSQNRVDTYVAVQEISGQIQEAHSFSITDGLGRAFATARAHPGSNGGFAGQLTLFDAMGRAIKTSNPTETNSSGSPKDWQPMGDDSTWHYTLQSYDWKGRPLVTTNQDGTTKTISYDGCGCAGGEIVTLTDEGSVDAAGVTKKRHQKVYSDVLGRVVKTEILGWGGDGVYSTTVNTYNARNQLKQMRQYAGSEGSTSFQDTTVTYDGYGRVKTKHTPEQDPNTFTMWTYNADDTVNVIIDARGATSTFTYNNNRGLVTTATYELTGSPTITVSYDYDSVGNRTSMTDPSGTTTYSYNSLSQLSSETRQFTGLNGQSFTMSYAYNLGGALKTFTLPSQFGTTVNYQYDPTGRLTGVTNTGYTYTDPTSIQQRVEVPLPTFLSNISYRAWNDLKAMDDGEGAHIQFDYNARLAPSLYTISGLQGGASMSWEYVYHPDNTIKLASDLSDNRFDRKYEYDNVGRLAEAYTGNEARGGSPSSPPDSPYRQTNTYDVFGNRQQQTGRIWQKALSGDSFTYENNRRLGLTYNAAGQVVTDTQGTHVFDTQGQRSLVTAGTVGGGGTGNPEMPAEERSTVYNGEGRPAIVTTTTRTEELNGEGPETNITTSSAVVHYLRSSVLNAVIAEIDGQGTRTKEYIYAGRERIAEWDITPWNDGIQWQHKNPVTGSWVSVLAGLNNAAERTEVDPSGRVTGNQPFIIPQDPPETPPTREEPYLIEGGPTIEAELGMQLYEDRYINQVFGPGAGPKQGNYSGDAWREWQLMREFQLMTGQRFLFGIDRMTANVPGTYEWVDQWEDWDDGSLPTQNPDGTWVVPSLRIVNRGYFRLVPGSGKVQEPLRASTQGLAMPFENCTFPAFMDLSERQRKLLNSSGGIDFYAGPNGLPAALKASFLNITGAMDTAGIDYSDARLQQGGIQSDRLLFMANTTATFEPSVQAAVRNRTFVSDIPVASLHVGMSSSGARQNRSLESLQVGFGPAGAFADIDRGNPLQGYAPTPSSILGFFVHLGEIIMPGKTDPFDVGRALGTDVTRYTCKRVYIRRK